MKKAGWWGNWYVPECGMGAFWLIESCLCKTEHTKPKMRRGCKKATSRRMKEKAKGLPLQTLVSWKEKEKRREPGVYVKGRAGCALCCR